ncbi:unnamed protein product, partial [marine sediment metagenome]
KRFENPNGFALLITDTMDESEVDARLERFKQLEYERIGLTLRPELIAVKDESGDASKFEALVNKVKQASDGSIILMSSNPDILAAGLKACADRKPLIYAATKDNLEAVASLAKGDSCPVAVKASSLEELADIVLSMTNETGGTQSTTDSTSQSSKLHATGGHPGIFPIYRHYPVAQGEDSRHALTAAAGGHRVMHYTIHIIMV